ncbi:MAG: acyl-CoA thioesterase, partial [Desulfovibrionales bacterium]
VFRHAFTVPESALDENGHVNNVVYVQWMQDAAVAHSDSTGGTRAARDSGGTWVVRSHAVEYLRPAYAGDPVEARTWVEDIQRIRSTRRYEFVRTSDDTLLARGSTQWVFVDAATGRPRSIPPEVRECYVPLESPSKF